MGTSVGWRPNFFNTWEAVDVKTVNEWNMDKTGSLLSTRKKFVKGFSKA